ncbi:uncharacterized protein CXorf65 homolog [Nematostella vectensis]|uniref:uncharacterized protein CXorf65 homolog n=1 Tax=Nematostella vectensis TaxID=45351 RepID=UPI0013905D45|nr:uncharacterized protein CXorf65 homolog [Nematostella vectensis]XP_048581836.1 uncharacterized protein CXorf65 homolog [Nematostella vectensis]
MAFITVRFGDDEDELFNPNFVTQNLLENIRRRCRCQRGVTLDLSDEEGDLKNLPDYLHQYAHKVLKPRETFVLVKIEKGLGDYPKTYTSMLNDLETSNPKLLARLEALSQRPPTRLIKSQHKKPHKKKSMWNLANRVRSKNGQRNSAGRIRSETEQAKTKNKTSGATPSHQNKTRQRKPTR